MNTEHNEAKNKEIIDALEWRYAVKTFDAAKKVSDADFNTIMESARMAPSSVGMEPWKFIVVKSPEIRAKLRAAAYDQTKVTDASHLVVIAARTDGAALPVELIERTAKAQGKTAEELAGLKGMAEGAVVSRTTPEALVAWTKAQTYIALGMMLETAALLGVDAGPMEGFNPAQIDEILGLGSKNLTVATMVAFGYRGEDAYAKLPKTRRAASEVIEVIE